MRREVVRTLGAWLSLIALAACGETVAVRGLGAEGLNELIEYKWTLRGDLIKASSTRHNSELSLAAAMREYVNGRGLARDQVLDRIIDLAVVLKEHRRIEGDWARRIGQVQEQIDAKRRR